MAVESRKPNEPKVLIIEDVHAFQLNASQIRGCRAWITDNLEDAREMFENYKPDFVISDMNFYRRAGEANSFSPRTSYLPIEVAQMCHAKNVGLAFVSGGDEVDIFILGPEEIEIAKNGSMKYKEDIEFQTRIKTTEIWQYALERLKEIRGWQEKSKESAQAPKPEPREKPIAKKEDAQANQKIGTTLREQMKIDYVACLVRLRKAGKISRESLKRSLKHGRIR